MSFIGVGSELYVIIIFFMMNTNSLDISSSQTMGHELLDQLFKNRLILPAKCEKI